MRFMKTWVIVTLTSAVSLAGCRQKYSSRTIDGDDARGYVKRCEERTDGSRELCVSAGNATDKGVIGHNFLEIYEQVFHFHRNDTLRILEIGVGEGWSLKLWERYFPKATVYGIDVRESMVDSGRIITEIADQSDRKQLQAFVNKHGGNFNIIIDDGGHQMHQQQISLGCLFRHVVPGGYYIVEDLHTSIPSFVASYGAVADGSNSTLSMLQGFMTSSHFRGHYLTAAENDYLTSNVDYVNISARSHLIDKGNGGFPSITAVIKKRPTGRL